MAYDAATNADVLFVWRRTKDEGSKRANPSNAVLCGNKLSPGEEEENSPPAPRG